MRIDSINKMDQIYQKASAKSNIKNAKKSSSDFIQISTLGRDLQVAKQAVKDTDDVRWDKVNEIKQRIQSGTYNVSAEEVANKMVDSYFSTSI